MKMIFLYFFFISNLHESTQNHFDIIGNQNNMCHEVLKKNNLLSHGMKANLVSIASNKYHNPQEPITVRVVSCSETTIRALLLETTHDQTTITSNLKGVKDDHHQQSTASSVACGIEISNNVSKLSY